MKTILSIDIGYGHTKVVFGTLDGSIIKKFKFQSAIGVTKKNPNVPDTRIYDYKEHSYYVGDNATALPSENRIDIKEYKSLEYYAPLLLHHALKQIDKLPDIVVAGLSVAQINSSGHFKDAIQNYTIDDKNYTFDTVYILPQGAGSKLTIDKYGVNFPKEQDEFLGQSNYVGVDIGFNTLDMFLVKDGKTSPALFEGIEREGVMKIATLLAKKVLELHGRTIGLHEAEQILSSGVYKLRGTKHNFKEYNEEVKKEYLKDLLKLIEVKYGKIIDQMDFISVTGGGAALFKTNTKDGFIRIPKANFEYFNSIGQFLFGCNKANQ